MAQFPLLPLLPLLAPRCLPHLLPFTQLTHPPPPTPQNPTCPAPNNDDLGNILALGIQNRDSWVMGQ